MAYRLERIEWDSQFFGYPIAKLVLPETDIFSGFSDDIIKTSPFDLTFVYCTQDQLSEAHQLTSPSFIETKVTFEIMIDPKLIDHTITLHKITNFDILNNMYYLALESGRFSRFRLDPNMKNFEFEKLYFEWIFKSIQGKFDHDVFVYMDNDNPLGLLTLKTDSTTAQIGLIASHSSYQGKGIGHKMLKFAKLYAYQRKCKYLTVATQQSNLIAMKFYEKNEFSIKKVECILHSWKLNKK